MNGQNDNYDIRRIISDELSYGEELLWCDKPMRGAHVSGRSAHNLIFGLFFVAFALFWTISAMAMGGVFGLFGLLFIFAGIYIIFGQSFKKSSMIYGITDKRVIIKTSRSTESIPFSSINQLS